MTFASGLRHAVSLTALLTIGLQPAFVYALPTGGQVAAGQASITTGSTQTSINQSSSHAVINWTGFDTNAGETVEFVQPSSSAIALNRISGSATSFDGSLLANGNVWLLNSNGILFGKNANVNVGGLLATTSSISNSNFMAGNYSFTPGGNPNAFITNSGNITVAQGGLAALVAPSVVNSGTITANFGRVQLAASDNYTVDLYGDGLINLYASPAITSELVANHGTINASGGSVALSTASASNVVGSLINMDGVINASDGAIAVNAATLENTGTMQATNGSITITAKNIGQQGTLAANGGTINETFSGAYIDNAASLTQAQNISLIGSGTGSSLFASGNYNASGVTGGTIAMTANQMWLYAATLNASGTYGGGNIFLGGGLHGDGTLAHAQQLSVNDYTTLNADATQHGNGGEIVAWSDTQTAFAATASAKGGANSGNGGTIEISSAGKDYVGGKATASAAHGKAGSVLIDPHNITISDDSTSGGLAFFQLTNPDPSSPEQGGGGNQLAAQVPIAGRPVPQQSGFGSSIVPLSTGNVVVTNPEDSFAASDAGAVYLFNGRTGALISTLTGSYANDQVGRNGITALTGNGNYVVSSSNWNDNIGAATWGNGTTGISGAVSSSNSLVGSTSGDNVGNNGITALSNGNFVVSSPSWNNTIGAATWGNGTTGISGAVSSSNSLVGSNSGDYVSGDGVTALTNGNYVVASSNWNSNTGAATWGNGTAGISGAVSSSNSLVGSNSGDNVGNNGITALSNGNYVVDSSSWNNGIGAATWGNGTTGITGTISAANSLVGSQSGDNVGSYGITALTNGNYVVGSPNWNGNIGAATWGSGTAGVSGVVSSSNSLVGSTSGDNVGNNGITALTNGNYVVDSNSWNSGMGAATWGNGTTGSTGIISSVNSLVGSNPEDYIGSRGVTALTNGNYVVASSNWSNGIGAVTWGNGAAGTTGVVSSSNSLVGSTSGDAVGNNSVTALTNGNYVVESASWNGNIGAATWGNGARGTSGIVSSSNSLVGSNPDDYVGSWGVTALTNGNYVVDSVNWNSQTGAVTWGNGNTGVSGVVTSGNSLVGSAPGDEVGLGGDRFNVLNAENVFNDLQARRVGGGGVTALTNGNYVVDSRNWNLYRGAVTWGNGATGTTGVVSSANSLVGSNEKDQVGGGGITALADGNYVVASSYSNDGAGAFTWGNGATGVTGTISTVNSILDSAGAGISYVVEDKVNGTWYAAFNNGDIFVAPSGGPAALSAFNFLPSADFTVDAAYLAATLGAGTSVTLHANNDITVADAVTVTNPNSSTLTLDAGRSILIDADITTDNGNLTLAANDPVSAGVVNANRDAGTAVIDTTGGTIDAGTGSVSITLNTGAGLTHNTAGDITLGTINAGDITAVNRNATGDVVLDGVLTASGSSTAVTVSSARDFVNDVGAGALDLTGGGRWLIYSTNPSDDTPGGLTSDFHRYSCTYDGSCPSFPGTGNGSLYSYTPLLTITPDALLASITAGSTPPNLTNYGYTVSGYLGSDGPQDMLTGSINGSTPYTHTSNVGSYAIDYSSGALMSALGYGFTYASNAQGITVTPFTAIPTTVQPTTALNYTTPRFQDNNNSGPSLSLKYCTDPNDATTCSSL